MDILNQLLADPRMNGIAAICAFLALLLGARTHLFGIFRILVVITVLAVFFTLTLNAASNLPSASSLTLSNPATGIFLALFSIFGIWAALDEYESLERAIYRAVLVQVLAALVLMIWLQLLTGRWSFDLIVATIMVGAFMGLFAAILVYSLNWVSDRFDNRLAEV